MAYTVLARKYRSRSFSEVIGQEPIATTLANAIRTGRIHHGYLFTGTRGVGKTSMARILAKALNCLKSDRPTPEPCCECDSCRAIAEGQDIDVVEIDAASNTGVDNIRELRGNTAYRPARARFKIYIIDEVHMLSTGAFNALLKTLEEPPEHVKFILATTELQKVPATIQSRCQRFVFRNIGPDEIADRLVGIIADEGCTAEPAAVRRIARLANGSMRDALSILDQLMSASDKKLTAAALDEMLPPPQDEQLLALLTHAADGNAAAVLTTADAVLNQGRGIEVLCHDLIETLRTLMLVRISGVDAPYADVPAAARDEYAALSQRFEPSQYVQMIAMLEELRRTVRFSGAGRALTDALMVRLANIGRWGGIEQLLAGRPLAPAGVAGREGSSTGAAPPRGATEAAALEEKKKPPSEPARARGELKRSPEAAIATTSRNAADVAYRRPLAPSAAGDPQPPGSRAAGDATGWSSDDRRPVEYDPGDMGEAYRPEIAPGGPPGARTATSVEASPAPTGLHFRPATPAERARVEDDPLMREVLELFDGVMTSCSWRASPTASPGPAE